MDFWCYSGDTDIGTAAYMHVCAALDWICGPNDSVLCMPPFDVIQEGPFSPRDNHLSNPTGPGLDATQPRDRLAYPHKLFSDNGPVDKNLDPADFGRNKRRPLV